MSLAGVESSNVLIKLDLDVRHAADCGSSLWFHIMTSHVKRLSWIPASGVQCVNSTKVCLSWEIPIEDLPYSDLNRTSSDDIFSSFMGASITGCVDHRLHSSIHYECDMDVRQGGSCAAGTVRSITQLMMFIKVLCSACYVRYFALPISLESGLNEFLAVGSKDLVRLLLQCALWAALQYYAPYGGYRNAMAHLGWGWRLGRWWEGL